MRKLAWIAAAILLVLLLWAVWGRRPDGEGSPPGAVEAEPAVEAAPHLAGRRIPDASRVPSESPPGRSEDVSGPPAPAVPPFRFRVSSFDGSRAIEGVRIRLRHAEAPGVTDVDGEASIVIPNPGAQASSYTASRPGYERVSGSASRLQLNEVRMRPGLRVSGRVLRASDDAPIEGATVRTWTHARRRETCDPVTTGPDGAFALDAVAPREPVWIAASVPGLHPVGVRHTLTEDTHGLGIRVGHGGTLEGRVLQADGEPAVGFEVRLLRPGMPLPPRREGRQWFIGGDAEHLRRWYYPTASTDEDGRYVFRGVPLVEDRAAIVRLSAIADVESEPVRFERDGETLVRDVDLPALASLTVQVLDAEGGVLPELQVDVTSPRMWFRLDDVGRQAEDGSWIVEGLVPGPWSLRAWIPSGEPVEREVVLSPGAAETVVLQEAAGYVVEGRVVDARGQPVPGARLVFSGPATRFADADEEGRFRLTGLPAEPGELEVGPGWWLPPRERDHPLITLVLEDVLPGGDALRIVLPDAGWIRGRLRGVEPGTELERRVFSKEITGRSNHLVSGDLTFRIPAPRPGVPFLLLFEAPDGRFGLRTVEALDIGEDHDLGRVVLDEGRVLEGRIVGAAGQAVGNARVRLTERWTRREARSGADGGFRFERVPRRPIWLRIDAQGHPPAFRVLDPRTGGVKEIRLSKGGFLELRVLDADASPLAEGTCSITWDVDSEFDADLDDLRDLFRLDPSGTTRLSREAAVYRVLVGTETYDQTARLTAEVRAGETTTVEVRLTRE